jgi:amidase
MKMRRSHLRARLLHLASSFLPLTALVSCSDDAKMPSVNAGDSAVDGMGGPAADGGVVAGDFHLREATITDIHNALLGKKITCDALIRLYFKRIKAYSGHCIKYDKNGDGLGPDYDFTLPSGKGVYLGVVEAVGNAGKVNAIQSVNLRPASYKALGFAPPHDPGPRSETDLVDADPKLPDALEVAATLDMELAQTGKLRPLHCVPMVIKDQMETADLRTTDGSLTQFMNDRPPNDGTLVAKLRAAGAIILAKANMDEYAGGTHRSSYAGAMCNPWATDRDSGSSSTGSATAVAVNLTVCGIAEESGGSVREPGNKSGVVAMTATRGLVSRFGSWPAELLRERYGPECRTVNDLAKVLEAIRGFDPKDPVTAVQVGYLPTAPLDSFAVPKSLAGRRIAIVREFMPKITVNDEDTIKVFNEEVVPMLKATGVTLVESVNKRDIAKGWAVDDPNIPNIDIQSIVADMLPTLEPHLVNPNATATAPLTPDLTNGILLPTTLRDVLAPMATPLFPLGTDIITKFVEMNAGETPFPEEISLRSLNNGPGGTLNEGRYGLEKMLKRRGDPRVKTVLDLSIDFDDLNGNGNKTEHITFSRINDDATGTTVLRNRPGVTPATGIPAKANGPSLDTQGQAAHVFRQMTTREIVMRILAEYNLDALVYPYETIPAKLLTGTAGSIAWLSYDGRPNRGYNSFVDAAGLPDIGVPAAFNRVVYDRTTRGPTTDETLALNPPSTKRDVMLPFSVQFMGRPWSEPVLLEIAAAFEKARGPRKVPPGHEPIEGEP